MELMAKGNPNWGKGKIVDWSYRVRGKNPDGDMVTLGKFEQESEARARYDELLDDGRYQNLRVQRLASKPAATEVSD